MYHHDEMTHRTSFDSENIHVIATTEQKIVKLKSLIKDVYP